MSLTKADINKQGWEDSVSIMSLLREDESRPGAHVFFVVGIPNPLRNLFGRQSLRTHVKTTFWQRMQDL